MSTKKLVVLALVLIIVAGTAVLLTQKTQTYNCTVTGEKKVTCDLVKDGEILILTPASSKDQRAFNKPKGSSLKCQKSLDYKCKLSKNVTFKVTTE